ncbi:MAG: metal ABC transporter permease [Acidobacteriota bacterium]|nr:MAG: metal ABC transporter permease [Acidobacteriota bacterium]
MSPQIEVQLIAVVVAVAAALPGTFLVLRRLALVSDAISHAILPGIVVAFFLVESLSSPVLLIAAAMTGLLTVVLIELLGQTRLLKEDASIALVFPALFSVGVLLISRYAGGVHLDVDAVLLGELAFAPFDRLVVAGHDLGAKALWSMTAILLLNVVLISVLYKELKLATLDREQAAVLGFAPATVHYLLMGCVSITAVGAFQAVGSILVVALMIAPPAAAYLLSDRLSVVLILGGVLGAASGVGGYWLARGIDGSIAGSMAVVAGLVFLGALLFAPQRGLAAQLHRRARQRWSFAERMLLVHLLHHERTPSAAEETAGHTVHRHLRWSERFTAEVIRRAEAGELLRREAGLLQLTERGRQIAQRALLELDERDGLGELGGRDRRRRAGRTIPGGAVEE